MSFISPIGRRFRRRPAVIAPLVVTLALTGVSAGAMASPILIPAGDLALRQDLEWLADRGVIELSTSTWPLPLAAVEAALDEAAPASTDAAQARLAQVRQQLARIAAPAPSIEAGYRNADDRLPHGFAARPRAEAELGVETTLSSDRFAANLRGSAQRDSDTGEDSEFNADGSYVAATAFGQILSLGWIDRYWGPALQGSTLLGNAAPPVVAVSLQRAMQTAPQTPWLHWLGNWTYQIFAGEQHDYAAVPHTKLIGMRATATPLPGLEIGLHRSMQFGGHGRPQGLNDFWDALIGRSNTTDSGSVTTATDPANQLGGVELRWSRAFGFRGLALFAQLTGDDESGKLPSRNTINAGVAYHATLGEHALTLRAESADLRTDRYWGARDQEANRVGYTYSSGIYSDGYYEQGLPLGYPIGGEGQLYHAGATLLAASGRRYGLELHHLKLNPLNQSNNQAYPVNDTVDALSLSFSQPWRAVTFDTRIAVQDSERDGTELGVTATLRIDLFRR